MEEGYTKARLDKRKLVTYKDMGKLTSSELVEQKGLADRSANVVSRSEEFDFLKGKHPLRIPIIALPREVAGNDEHNRIKIE